MTEWKKVESNIWRPETAEESIEGVLVDKKPSEEFDNQVYTIQNVVNGLVVLRTVYGTTVLDDRMKEVQIGKNIKIIYKGEKKVKKGMSKMFEVFVEQ